MCPECGMSLVETREKTHAREGRDKHEGHDVNVFARKFWVSLVLTVPVLLYSPMIQEWIGWRPPVVPGEEFIPLVLGSVVFFYGGWIFISSAWRELKGKAPGMMTLIALAIITAYVYSIYQVARGEEETLFWELTTLIVIMLLGHWIEMRAVQGARGALQELSILLPDTAEVVRGQQTETVPLEHLQLEDIVIVRPGGKVPADGIVTEGSSHVNESLVTGESAPVSKKPGSEVVAGSINGDGSLHVRVTKIGEDTFLAGVKRLVLEAEASKSKLQLLSDRFAFYLTIIAVASGLLALLAWLLILADPNFAVERMVAVLVIACPHALGLAVPLVASISTSMAARSGFFIRDRLAMEAARNIDVVLFDKTGTLTEGSYAVDTVWGVGAVSEDEVLVAAASVNTHSEHFIAHAVVDAAQKRGVSFQKAQQFRRLPGKGVRGVIGDKEILVGGHSLVEDMELNVLPEFREVIDTENAKGKTIVYILRDKELMGVVALSDAIREESKQAIRQLKAVGVEVGMITGDSEKVAAWVAEELGIDMYFAQVMPEDKANKVKELQQAGKNVAMVGDGVNDAPALTQADIGIAIGAGTNVAVESAGIILVKNDPRDIARIITLSQLTYRKMIQNLFWATGYNVVALPLAGGVAVAWGIVLQPAVAAILMSASTVIVAINAVLLRMKSL
jgi:P-type Cu2+ transporter